MDSQQAERTIYFKDLVFSIMYRWRTVLVAMLVGAVLMGGMEWIGGSNEVTLNTVSITPENQIKIDQYRSTLERTQKLIDSHSVYLEQSILISLDSYAAYTAGIYASVYPMSEAEAEDAPYDQTAAILHAYRTGIMDTAAMEAIGKKHDIEQIYLVELITTEVTNTGILRITVRGRTPEEAEAITASLKETLQSQQENISQVIMPHKLQMSSFHSGPVIDKALYDLQNTAQQRLTTLKNTATTTTTELNKLLPTQLQAGQAQPVLFAVVGAFLGAFLVAVIACVQHIGSGKVYSARTLKDRTGVRILGCVCGKNRSSIDRWLRKLEGRTIYTQPDGIIANIVNRCTEYKHLLVFGCCDADMIRPLMDELTRSGIQCTLCPEPAGSVQAIKALPNCNAAVLVETCGESAYDDVIWTMETVGEYGKTLLGCVLIDG